MKPILSQVIICDQCGSELLAQADALQCQACQREVPLQNNIPLFTPSPPGLQPSKKLVRGPHAGTPWRQANWRFLEEQLRSLPAEALILDVGAGRGDFADLLVGHSCIELDVYPYPEVDIVCDLIQQNPFRASSFNAILLMNVLEHIYDTYGMLEALSKLLKPGGILVVAIPFMVKMHQVPIDYVRYTHYALQRLGQEHGMDVELMEGYYDPIFFLGEGLGNLRYAVLPTIPGVRRYLGRVLLAVSQILASSLKIVTGPGQTQPPEQVRSQAPTGYHVVYHKKLNN